MRPTSKFTLRSLSSVSRRWQMDRNIMDVSKSNLNKHLMVSKGKRWQMINKSDRLKQHTDRSRYKTRKRKNDYCRSAHPDCQRERKLIMRTPRSSIPSRIIIHGSIVWAWKRSVLSLFRHPWRLQSWPLWIYSLGSVVFLDLYHFSLFVDGLSESKAKKIRFCFLFDLIDWD